MNTITEGILVSNHHYIGFNKPGGMAVQSVQNKEQSLEVVLYHYCKTQLFLIHRIDQPCSGIVLFAKKKNTAAFFNQMMQNHSIDRVYLAVTSVKPEVESGTLSHFLFAHKKSNKSFIVDADHKEGKPASLDFKYLGTTEPNRHLLEIKLHTGRHHQIRAQLGAIGCPIIGDVKYGSKYPVSTPAIALHAWQLGFDHPVDHKRIELKAPLPQNELWTGTDHLINTK